MPYRIINANFNFFIVPLSLGILFKIKKLTYLIAILFLTYLVWFALFGKDKFVPASHLNIISVAVMLGSFGMCFLSLYSFISILEMEKTNSITRLKSVQSDYKEIDEKNTQIRINNEILENKVSEIANLYQISKEMSRAIEFEAILKILNDILVSFKFTNCELILIQEVKQNYEILKICQIPASDKKMQITYEEMLLELICYNKAPILIDSPTDPIRNKLYLKEDTNTFFAQPIVMRDKLEAILVLENLPAADFKKILITGGLLGMQLERIRLYELVQQMAITDGLTGIFSRRHFMERFDEELKRSIRFNTNLAYLMIDIDHFKDYNDKYGHLVGDVILKEIATIFKNNIRQLDLIGRYGGEEFSIILPETNRESAAIAASRLREAVEQYVFKAYDEVAKVSVSIGIAVFPDDAGDLQQLIDRADQALYKAKQTGRNKICVYHVRD